MRGGIRGELLRRDFYERDPVTVSRALLGKILVRRKGQLLLAGRIVETEAYLGGEDPAAHAYVGLTDRNRVLFGPGGYAYVYFIYGVHYCLNFSCMRDGEPGGTLIRALEPLEGIDAMEAARGLHEMRQLTNGPGKLCQAFGITRARDNGKDMCSAESDLQVWTMDEAKVEIAATPRVGITKAAELPLRFVVRGNPYLSRRER